jgi:hypothetical protein
MVLRRGAGDDPRFALRNDRRTITIVVPRRCAAEAQGLGGHPRAQHAGQRLSVVDDDLDRDALDDLGEIAGRIVRRQQRKFLTARRGNAVEVAVHRRAERR